MANIKKIATKVAKKNIAKTTSKRITTRRK